MDPFRPPEDPDLDNPYAPPRSTAVPAAAPPISAGIPFTVGDVFSWSWAIFKERLIPCIYVFWSAMSVSWAIGFVIAMVSDGLWLGVRQPASLLFLRVAFRLTGSVAQIWLGIGINLGLIQIARREPVSLAVIFTGGRSVLKVILASISVGILVVGPLVVLALGLVPVFLTIQHRQSLIASLLFVLGCALGAVLFLYLMARFLLFYYLVIDRNLGVVESIQRSWQLTTNQAATIILVYLVQLCVFIAGLLACGVGLIFAWPLSTLIGTVTYLALTEPANTAEKASPVVWQDEL